MAQQLQQEPEQDTDVVFELRGVEVMFDSSRGRSKVVDDVDLDIYRGETLGIVGESGSGKSMLASSVMDAVENPGITRGEITFYPEDGDPIEMLELKPARLRQVRWEDIAMVFQGAMSSFNPTQDFEGHFKETLTAHNYDVEEGMERARGLLEELNLDPDRMLELFPHELSGGQKQRTLVALALLLEPEVLVLDEPTAALDLLMQRSILNLLHSVREEHDLTMIFISHDLPVVAGFADRVAVMYAFDIVELGTPRTVMKEGAHPYTRALIKATPTIDMPISEMKPIPGRSPDPVNVPTGCSYHPRCPLADQRCEHEDPALLEIDDGHRVACFYYEQAAAAVPLSFDNDGDDK